MNKLQVLGRMAVILLFSLLTLPSCQDMEEYYEVPDWIGGSIWQTLSDKGNYGIFLQGVELAGYEPIVNGKQILTVMAPDDEAMKSYLKENYDTENITEVSADELSKLIGYHIMYYSFDKQRLTNFQPTLSDGATETEKNMNAGYYYKFRTRSQDPLSYVNESTKDSAIYHFERLLPIFSYRLFDCKGIDAATNYEYFYPNSTWTGSDGFNVAEASVNEYALTTTNGYIYTIDRVLTPTETIYKELQTAGNYTKFLTECEKYRTYVYDGDLTLNYGNGENIYQSSFKSGLPDIDCEWPTKDYEEIDKISMKSYVVFAPTDQAWEDFFNDYWGYGGYESLDEVDSAAITAILFNSFGYYKDGGEVILFPEEIDNGDVINPDGDVISFNTQEAGVRKICTNGVLYGMDVLTPPAKYISVTGPAYQYKKYANFSLMIDKSGLANTLTTTAVNYIMFHANDDQILNARGLKRDGNDLVDIYTGGTLSSSGASSYVYAHVVAPDDGDTEIPTAGKKVYRCLSPDLNLYWYVKDGKITNSVLNNRRLKYADNLYSEADAWVTFKKLAYRGDENGWRNGHAYEYDETEQNFFEGNYSNENYSKFINLMYQKRLDSTTEFFAFVNLLIKAGLLSGSSSGLTSVDNESFRISPEDNSGQNLIFIPTTELLEEAILGGKIPGIEAQGASVGAEDFFDLCEVTDKEALQKYLALYIIPKTTAVITNYPYVGWGEDTKDLGGVITSLSYVETNEGITETTDVKINIYDDGNTLSVAVADISTGENSTSYNTVNVYSGYDYFPFIFEDGAFHFLDGVF